MRDLLDERFDARAAYDGKQASSAAKEWHPDILILDLLMPEKDGFEVLQELQSDPSTSGIQVVVLSNLGKAETVERVKPFKISDYLIKADTTPREVVARIKGLAG